jgi:U3 small nucleolar RNA-associated protein 4
LSPDGSFLAVATVTCVRVFSLRRQKGIEKDILRVQRLDVLPELAKDGARLVCISPDSRWLCVVRPNSDILLVRIQPASAQARSRIISNVSKLRRVPRYSRYEKPSHGTLGNFDRTIRTVVFSEDSRILASGDLSGCVDIWLLESVGELLSERPAKKVNQTTSSDDESSDDEDEQPIFDGQRWQLSLRETPIPRLGSGVILMLFRPPRLSQPALLTNGENHSPSGNNICLMVITSDHRLVEFDVQSGKYSDWARRNPKAYLPAEFTSIKDRAMGGIWDSNEGRERLWLYGTSWLWMFDLEQDFPPPENAAAATKDQTGPEASGQLIKSSSLKRKRELDYEEDDIKGKSNSGAGDRISRSQADISLGAKFKKIVGKDESQGEWVSFRVEHQQDIIGEDEDERDDFVGSSDSNFAMLRRDYQGVEKVDSSQSCHNTGMEDTKFFRIGQKATSVAIVIDNSSSNHIRTRNEAVNENIEGGPASPSQQQMMEVEHDTSPQPPRRWWYTFKYRDILGIVQLRSPSESDEDNEEIKPKHGNNHFEVVIVERPMWDVNLPGRYLRDYE